MTTDNRKQAMDTGKPTTVFKKQTMDNGKCCETNSETKPTMDRGNRQREVRQSSGRLRYLERSLGKLRYVDRSSGKLRYVEKSSWKLRYVERSSGKWKKVEFRDVQKSGGGCRCAKESERSEGQSCRKRRKKGWRSTFSDGKFTLKKKKKCG